MRKDILFILVLLLLMPGVNFAQVMQEWEAYFEGDGNFSARSVTVDIDGNTYITGYNSGIGAKWDFITVKFNPLGLVEWDISFNGDTDENDSPNGITSDRDGNIYVIGGSRIDFDPIDIAIVKYNNVGEEQWSALFSEYDFNNPRAVVVDSSGNVYVTGTGINSDETADYITIKYNSSGEEQWKSFYNGNPYDGAIALALDNQNNVYVTGTIGQSAFSPSTFDIVTIKYNNDGEEQWVVTYDGGNGGDAARSIAVDASGNVYVTGYTYTSSYDYITIKYNSSGEEQWVKTHDGGASGGDFPVKLLLDNQGNIIVTGTTIAENGDFTSEDFATIKYNSSGDELWVRTFNGASSRNDKVFDMIIDNGSNIYITGYSRSGDGFVTEDIATIKYGPDGTEEWVELFNNSENTADEPVGIGLDNSGNVYVGGSSKSTYIALKYSQVTDVKQIGSEIPDKYFLSQNYPNPFNPTTNFEFQIADVGFVSLKIYDILGNEIAALVNEEKTAGTYEVTFDASGLSSGVYFYKLQAERFTDTKKLILMK